MRIRVNGRVCAPESSLAGIAGDHRSEALLFIFGGDVPEGNLYLKTELGTIKDKISLDPASEREYVCKLERQTIPESGIMRCQLTAEHEDPEGGEDVIIWQSREFSLRVERSVDADGTIEKEYPTLLLIMRK